MLPFDTVLSVLIAILVIFVTAAIAVLVTARCCVLNNPYMRGPPGCNGRNGRDAVPLKIHNNGNNNNGNNNKILTNRTVYVDQNMEVQLEPSKIDLDPSTPSAVPIAAIANLPGGLAHCHFPWQLCRKPQLLHFRIVSHCAGI